MRVRSIASIWFAITTALPVVAHHNITAMYDLNLALEKTGALAKLDWRNPHVYLAVEVETGDGEKETWSFEGPPPHFFRTRGLTKEDFDGSLGKIVTIEGRRARNDSNSGLWRQITLADGRVVSACC